MTLKEKLSAIQREMKAPKNLYNKFGGYSYRNAEGILEAFKPFEEKYKVALVVTDAIELIGGRFYVAANARLFDTASDEYIEATAFAREQDAKKGMDEAQITGSASSYARKYALNGLFLLDDTKDPDTDESQIEGEARAAKQKPAPKAAQKTAQKPAENFVDDMKIGDTKAKALEFRLGANGISVDVIYKQCKVNRLADLTEKQHASINKWLDGKEVGHNGNA